MRRGCGFDPLTAVCLHLHEKLRVFFPFEGRGNILDALHPQVLIATMALWCNACKSPVSSPCTSHHPPGDQRRSACRRFRSVLLFWSVLKRGCVCLWWYRLHYRLTECCGSWFFNWLELNHLTKRWPFITYFRVTITNIVIFQLHPLRALLVQLSYNLLRPVCCVSQHVLWQYKQDFFCFSSNSGFLLATPT